MRHDTIRNHSVRYSQPDAFMPVWRCHGRTESEAKAFDFLEQASKLDKIGIMADVTMIKLKYLLHKPVEQQLFDTVLYKLVTFPLDSV